MEIILLLLLLVPYTYMSVVAASDSSSSSSLNKYQSSICDYSRVCGPNGNCDLDEAQTCVCLDGFTPKSPTDFAYLNFRLGCVRNKALNCSTDVFVRHSSFKEPSGGYSLSLSNQQGCLGKCKSDCSCMAYKVIVGGCKLWNGDLFDVRLVKQGGQDLYIRMPASEEQGKSEARGKKQGRNEGVAVGIVVGSSVVISMIIIASWYMFRERTASKALEHVRINEIVTHDTNVQILQKEDMGLPLFDLSRIIVATDNFSPINKLGEGGFGSVYKGILNDGQQIAVKRLSSSSGQGLKELKTEVKLIAKLQHRNLVKLFGCCIQVEKLLIYEYMPNKSLDYFIFDQVRRSILDWSKRFTIISGIAKGLLYLYQDSRLRIIHRDIKTSNILLDTKMEPKISDFGLARSFESGQSKRNTSRIVGTFGYMAPEYAVNGQFSIKSDVFSFGILLLEIVSGKRNRRLYYSSDNDESLYENAWDLWKQGRSLELVDESLKDSWNLSEVQRCIHIGLLCAQQNPHDRPTMSSVVLMLGSEIDLPQPKAPKFFICDPFDGSSTSTSKNELSVTEMGAR